MLSTPIRPSNPSLIMTNHLACYAIVTHCYATVTLLRWGGVKGRGEGRPMFKEKRFNCNAESPPTPLIRKSSLPVGGLITVLEFEHCSKENFGRWMISLQPKALRTVTLSTQFILVLNMLKLCLVAAPFFYPTMTAQLLLTMTVSSE